MKVKKSLYLLLVFIFAFGFCNGQNEDSNTRISNSYNPQAIFEYETALKQNFSLPIYYALLDLYTQGGETKNAQKLIEKAQKQEPDNPLLIADMGFLYLQSDQTKAIKQFTKAINSLRANNNTVVALANHFSSHSQDAWAIQTYKQARELFKDQYRYIYELTSLYQKQGKYTDVIDEYMLLLDQNPSMLSQIQIYLGNLLSASTDDKLQEQLRKSILSKTQKNPSNQNYAQFYLWFILQEKNYSLAIKQAKSIDKRFDKQSGQTLFSVSSICLNNSAYSEAKEGFSLIIEKGQENPYYMQARQYILSCLYYSFIQNPAPTQKEKEYLRTQYSQTLALLGQRVETVESIQQYAYLLAYYLSSAQEAVDLLDSIISLKRINPQDKAQSKLMRADIFLMNGDVWEASLTYSQVEKEFKNDVVGSEAKFKNAMLSYYNGDFDWAYSQFSSLRASTEKLIANDAMEQSLLISENRDEDSSFNGLALYSRADFALYCHNYDRALALLDTLNQKYLSHPLFDEVLYMRAQIAITKQEYHKADSLLNLIILKYSADLMADDALYLLAQINETYLSQPQKAKEYYEKIIFDYPESLYVTPARKKLNNSVASGATL